MTNRNIIKNYLLEFGELGIQIKFNKDLKQSEIKNVMYYFESYISQLNSDYRISKNLFDIANKNFKTINDIQS